MVWAQASILVVMQFFYALTVGPLGYVISSETPSTMLRAKTLSITATVNGFSYLILTVLGPVLLNPGAAGAGSKTQFLFGGISLICLVWASFRLPEVSSLVLVLIDPLTIAFRLPAGLTRSWTIFSTRTPPLVSSRRPRFGLRSRAYNEATCS